MENSILSEEQSGQHDLLNFENHELFQFQYASQGQRFVNLIIDNILMKYTLSYGTGFIVAYIINAISPEFLYEMVYGQNQMYLILFGYFAAIMNYIIYYTLCEKLFKGYTLGKLISGTRAVRKDGTELTFKDALLRSLIRCVPFEIFTGFATLTWHDSWTDTMVIKAR